MLFINSQVCDIFSINNSNFFLSVRSDPLNRTRLQHTGGEAAQGRNGHEPCVQKNMDSKGKRNHTRSRIHESTVFEVSGHNLPVFEVSGHNLESSQT